MKRILFFMLILHIFFSNAFLLPNNLFAQEYTAMSCTPPINLPTLANKGNFNNKGSSSGTKKLLPEKVKKNKIKTNLASEKLSIFDYIKYYRPIAMAEMKRTQIPASIKLAQGILESQYGNSTIARKANNHFGIKCFNKWQGLRLTTKDSDGCTACYRKYQNPYLSFIDHSNVLRINDRYKPLFENEEHDYGQWAKDLEVAGYSTNNKYAELLIDIINRYELYDYDIDTVSNKRCSEAIFATPATYNGLKTVIFDCDVNLEQIERAYQVPIEKVGRYNGFSRYDIVPAHTLIYLQAPRNKGIKSVKQHIVSGYETIEDIARLYGIKPEKLYAYNKLGKNMRPAEGEVIVLRGKAKTVPKASKIDKTKKRALKYHLVQEGDTLYSISKKYNTSVFELRTVNKLAGDHITPLQKLQVYSYQ